MKTLIDKMADQAGERISLAIFKQAEMPEYQKLSGPEALRRLAMYFATRNNTGAG